MLASVCFCVCHSAGVCVRVRAHTCVIWVIGMVADVMYMMLCNDLCHNVYAYF